MIPSLKSSRCRRPAAGFTLIELMITVTVIAILAAIAYPSYSNYRLKTTRSYAIDCLTETQRRMENMFARSNSYPADLSDPKIGYSSATPSCGDSGQYQLSLTYPTTCANTTTKCYQLVATPQGAQAKDGTLRLSYDAGTANTNSRLVKDHQPPGGSWVTTDGWSFQPGK